MMRSADLRKNQLRKWMKSTNSTIYARFVAQVGFWPILPNKQS